MDTELGASPSGSGPCSDKRAEFLLAMYHELWSNINRHVLVLWQSLGTLLGAAALFGLVEKKVISLDAATTLFLVLPGWLIATALDSSTWYNRNILLIRNIEQQFLLESDVHDVHYYFRDPPRPNNEVIGHFRVQIGLALVLSFLVLIYHFVSARIWQGMSMANGRFIPSHAIPYLEALAGGCFLFWWRAHLKETYETLVSKSPGLFSPADQ